MQTQANFATQSASDVAIGRDPSVEMMKLIRKLRWIGRDEEARDLERQLSLLSPLVRGSVLADPGSTD